MKPILTKNIVLKLTAVAILGGVGTFAFVNPINAQAPLSPESVSPMDKPIQIERDRAVALARDGKFDEALTSLSKLHDHYADVEGITRDYLAVLSWAGHDEESVHLYESIPADQPDYVLSAAGHSYRVLKQPEKALAAYRLGTEKYLDNVVFTEGEIRTLIDQGKLDDALVRTNNDLRLHGNRAEIISAKADIIQAQIKIARENAVQLARDKHYADSIALFRGDLLDAQHTTDAGIRSDYLAVLSWASKHDAEVVAIFQSLKDSNQPDYVLEAAAKSYRNLHRSEKALALYRQGMKQYPENTIFAMGEIHTLLDQKRVNEASSKIKAFEKNHGSNADTAAAKRDIAQIQFNVVRDKAAHLARDGHYEEALAILKKLGGEHSKNIGILRDRIAITGWMGGHDQEVVDQYLALKNPEQPDYVLEAVAKAYRTLGKEDESIALYEQGLKRHPASESYAVGTIRTLTEGGYIEKALDVANDNLKQYGNRINVLLAAAEAANQYDQADAMQYYVKAVQIAPQDPDVLRGLIRTSDRLGAPEVALKTIEDHPGIVSDSERRQIEGDEAASLVRLGQLEQEEQKSFIGTDHAIDRLNGRIAQWQQEGPEAQININRARYDRIIALHNRSRMQDVITEYAALNDIGAEPPVFALGAVGDAYLDTHQPEKARDIFVKLLDLEPHNNLARRQLFYTYVDLGDVKNAYRIADDLVADGTTWDRSKNAPVPMSDAEKRDTALTAGAARLYFGEITEADKRILPVATAFPDAPSSHEALGNLDNAHNWPRQALQEYETGRELAGGESVSNEVGIANTELALHNFPQAEEQLQSLTTRYPQNLSVLRAQRDYDVYNMAEVDVYAGYYFEPMTSRSVNGGQAFGIDTKVYSTPYKYNWRLFAGEYFTQQKEPNNEGSVGFSRSTAGVEYRNGPITSNLGPTFDTFHGTDRVGAAADATYAINDNWTIAGAGEILSRETPLRALNQGVTADLGTVHAVWQQDESRSVRFGGSVMPFSDGNFRTEEDVDVTQRLWTRPYWKIDGIASFGMDQNSKDENRSYYNPSGDFIGLIGARAIQTLYQRYATLWQHSLQVTPGAYWQSHFGTDPAIRARYEHRVFFNQTFEAGLGINFARQDYDGQAENDVSVTFDLVDHF